MKKSSEEKIMEEDLYIPVYNYLVKQGYTVNSEVKYCDVTAIKDNELLVVELKLGMNMDLILQATRRLKSADSVYVAILKPKGSMNTARWKDIYHLLKRLELGLMIVTRKKECSFVEVAFHPTTFDRERSMRTGKKKKHNIIREIHGRHGDFNTGGSCRKKLMTAYRESAIFIACCFRRLGQLSPKNLRVLGTDPKKTLSILAKNHYGWFEKIEKGKYAISEQGIKDLENYDELVQYYMKKIDEKMK